ncbi:MULTISPECIES: STAS domain-containing protein [Alteribacter]|uniref:Anti-sigma factor antagonist n=1 Tax=Alteribacter keqinensis TaxID=2483800 RepID=A0A3M7TMR0_9BACI|nr:MULTISPECIES: STAS domain-containing protein [Alteribacter]MBM7096819.1 STAS domain-containing protein [Alteribacter salitolerans]RNA66352.1 anti-sigma factor antagonist [Alteribacter keqinensis]
MNLHIDIKENGPERYVSLAGEIDVYTVPKLKEELIPVTEEPNKQVIVDLSGINYIDSTGLGVFIGALKATDQSGSSLKITGVNDRVRRLFTITGLDEVIEIEVNEREEA